ncbi:tumor protein D54 [Kryptolebias marmoratus]|uniref:Tpd52 like 2a n=1 Tax=Kryptolebias marmoratus TaxID=37003 RepID=A0A3Q2ZTT8_KRYMA|nr:tumor protein D54 [Kryptolebias marmoratus]
MDTAGRSQHAQVKRAAMSRQDYDGTSPSVNLSTRLTGNGCPHAELRGNDWDNLRLELAKTEDEIQTLRQVLLSKEKYAADIRRQLGLSPLSNVKQNLYKGWQEVQTSAPYLTASATLDDISHSSTYVRTRDGLSHAGQMTSAALSSVGEVITRRLTQMRALPLPSPSRTLSHSISVPTMRHSSTFRSFEEIVGNVKDKVTGSLSSNGDTSGFERRYMR